MRPLIDCAARPCVYPTLSTSLIITTIISSVSTLLIILSHIMTGQAGDRLVWGTVRSKARHRIKRDNAQPRDPLVRPIARACYLTLCVSGALINNHRSTSRRCAAAKKLSKAPLLAAVELKLRRCRRCRALFHVMEASVMMLEGHALQTRLHCGEANQVGSPRIRGCSLPAYRAANTSKTKNHASKVEKV